MDNLTPTDNQALEVSGTANAGVIEEVESAPEPEVSRVLAPDSGSNSWKKSLRSDLRDSPLSQKFEDTPEGLNKALESYANLEKLLGHEKVPIPKDINDVEGWNRYSKAMGIPEKPQGYGLADAKIPESMKDLTLDKNKFAEVMHANRVHPSAVKGIWETYQKMAIDAYKNAMEKHSKQLTDNVNRLKGEWGDAYNTKIELGQAVINKFSEDKEMNDYLTATLSQDARGIKFLSKLGEQFAENKIGEFTAKRFSLTPDEAMERVSQLKSDLNGPYWNRGGRFSAKEQEVAISEVNGLLASIQRAKG